jgi:Alginate export
MHQARLIRMHHNKIPQLISLTSLSSLAAMACLLPQISMAAEAPWTLQSAVGSEHLKVSGSVRARYEVLDGQSRVGLDASPDLLSFRTILAAEYLTGRFHIGGELYDSRAYWGDASSGVSANEVNALELVQAYVAMDVVEPLGANTKASIKAGRFTLNLGSRRLVAADDYRNTTNGYTGLRVEVSRKGGASGTLIYTMPQRRLPDDLPSIVHNDIKFDSESAALKLWGGIATLPKLIGNESLDISFFRLNESDVADLATRNRQLSTTDARLFRDPAAGKWDYEVEAAYQSGSVRASTAPAAATLSVAADFYHLEVGFQSTGVWQPRVSVEYDQASGDDSHAHYGRFDTLFGMRRADFAPSALYATVGRANIRSPGIRVDFVPSARLDAFIGYRGLWLDSKTDSFSTTGVRDATGQSGSFAGHQIDSRARYWLVPKVLRLEGDAVFLFKGRFLKDAPNAPRTDDTHYGSINLSVFF